MPLTELRGHQRLYRELQTELASRPSHGYLFSGPRGVGKSLVAQALVHGIMCERSPGADFCCTPQNCPVGAQASSKRRSGEPAITPCDCCAACVQVAMRVHPDVTMVERAANRTDVLIEQVRDLIARMGTKPSRGPRRLVIIDDAETLNIPAQNALLKTLEEPPGDAIIFMIACGDRMLLDTIRSRLRPVRFGPLSVADIAAILTARAGLDEERAMAIGRLSRGSASRALAMAEGESLPIDSLLQALKRAPELDFIAARELADEFFSGREQASATFELMARLLEEILTLKLLEGESASSETRPLMAELGKMMSVPVLVAGVELAVRACQAVEGMANPRLQAEQWWMAISQSTRGTRDTR
jgi:DNA polymerase-3 subunit delta'